MTTNLLQELQRTITPGDWSHGRLDAAGLVRNPHAWKPQVRSASKSVIATFNPHQAEVEANTTAVSYVPELIAEVLALRSALHEIELLAIEAKRSHVADVIAVKAREALPRK